MGLRSRFGDAFRAFRGTEDEPEIVHGYQIGNLREELAHADPLRLYPASVFEAYNPSVLVSRKGMEVYDKMRRDDEVKAALAFKKHAVISAGWRVDSPEGQDREWEVSEFVRMNLKALVGTLEQSILEILTAIDFGFSVTEKIFEDREGQVWLGALKTRRPHSFKFAVDQFGNVRPNGIIQEQPTGSVSLPKDKFVHYAYCQEFSNPYGMSDLDAAYEQFFMKSNSLKWLAMMLERFGIPPVFALYDPNRYTKAQLDTLKTVMSRLQAATNAIIPRPSSGAGGQKDALDLFSPELAGQVSSVFIPAIEFFDRSIARAILMPGTLGLTLDNVGSMARAKVIFDLFMFIIEFLRTEIEERIMNEQIVKPLVDLNYAVDEYPQFRFMPITEEARLEMMKTWMEMLTAGAVEAGEQDEPHIRQSLGFPERTGEPLEPDEEDEPPDEEEPPPDGGQPPTPPQGDSFKEVIPTRLPEGPPVERDLTEAEKQIDFVALTKSLDSIETRQATKLQNAFSKASQTILRNLKTRGPKKFSTKILPNMGPIRTVMTETTRAAFTSGRQSALEEVRGVTELVDDPIAEKAVGAALQALIVATFTITGILSNTVMDAVREAILLSIQQGETSREAVERVQRTLQTYTGIPGDVNTPSRIETIIRNATTNAFNQGRLNVFLRKEFEDTIPYVQHSSILDTRTTEVCRFLDGRLYRRTDPALIRLTPPLHHRCRSILVPVDRTISVNSNDIMDETAAGRALGMAQARFV